MSRARGCFPDTVTNKRDLFQGNLLYVDHRLYIKKKWMQPLSQKSDVIAEVPKTLFLMASSGQLKYRPLRNVSQLPSSTT